MFMSFLAYAQEESKEKEKKPVPQIVEASCGQCNFGMKGGGCNLAVKIDGKPYFVDGVKHHELGDSHGENGMCNVVRQAEVEGAIVDDRFHATSFKWLSAEKPKKGRQQ